MISTMQLPSYRSICCCELWKFSQHAYISISATPTHNPLHPQGRTYAPLQQPDELADAMRDFNARIVKDPRVEVVALPFRDGVNLVYRR